MSSQVGGLPALLSQLEQTEDRLRDVSPALEREGARLESAQSARAPRWTGLLAGRVVVRASASTLTLTSLVDYFAPVHEGAPRHPRGARPARPWLRDIVLENKDRLTDAVADYVTAPLK